MLSFSIQDIIAVSFPLQKASPIVAFIRMYQIQDLSKQEVLDFS